MYKKFKYFIYLLLFGFIFLPIIYLFISILFPNLKLIDIYSFWNYMLFSFDSRIVSVFFRTLLIGFSVSILSRSPAWVLKLIPQKNFQVPLVSPVPDSPLSFHFLMVSFPGKERDLYGYSFPKFIPRHL